MRPCRRRGESAPLSETPPEMQDGMVCKRQNVDFFLAHYLLPLTSYQRDIATSQRGSAGVVVSIGEESGGQLPQGASLALADGLGPQAMTCPGDHAGYLADPEAFTEQLHEVFQTRDPGKFR